MKAKARNRYEALIETIFVRHYTQGDTVVAFRREELEETAKKLKIQLPKNLGDVIYSFGIATLCPPKYSPPNPQDKNGSSRARELQSMSFGWCPSTALRQTLT